MTKDDLRTGMRIDNDRSDTPYIVMKGVRGEDWLINNDGGVGLDGYHDDLSPRYDYYVKLTAVYEAPRGTYELIDPKYKGDKICDIGNGHKIIIGGRDIYISEESFKALKEQLL